MATVFDGDTLTITLSAPTAGVLELAVSRLYSEWKEWQLASFQNVGYPPAFRVVGGDDLTPGIKAGAYYFLRNDLGWRIKSTEEDQTIYIEGNLAPQNAALEVAKPTTGDFTVAFLGLQPITQNVGDILEITQANQYGGAVFYDESAVTSGTARPFGTASSPVNNEADLLVVAARENIRVAKINGSLTMTQAYDDWAFEGDSPESDQVILNGQSVNHSAFSELRIDGDGAGSIVSISGCSLHGVSGLGGNWRRVGIASTLTLTTIQTTLHHSYSEVPGSGRPVVDGNNVAVDCAFRGWIGGMEVTRLSAGSMTIDGDPVRLRFTASCTNAAECVAGGSGILDGNLGTIVPLTSSFISEPTIATEVMAANVEATYSLQDVLRLLGAIAAGDITQQLDGSYVIKGLDDSTSRILGQLATNNGRNVTSRNVA
jgi:hypothetical protein